LGWRDLGRLLVNELSKDWDLYSLIKYEDEPEVWCLYTSGCYEWVRSQIKIAKGKYSLKVRICPVIRFGQGEYEEKTWDFNEMMKDQYFRENIDIINANRGIKDE
jgi:hypothetical protein